MSRSVRSLSAWFLLSLFTVLSVSGESWHLLPGLNHCECAEGASSCDFGRSLGCSDSQHDASPAWRVSAKNADSDCPLCKFFTQSQSDVVARFNAIEALNVEGLSATPNPTASRFTPAANRCRAPPCSLA